METKKLCESKQPIIKDNLIEEETSFVHILENISNRNENKNEDKIIHSFENTNDAPIEAQGTYTTTLEPGARIFIIKRKKRDILVGNISNISVATETQYDIIDSNKSTENYKKTKLQLMNEWLVNSNKKIEELECTLKIEKDESNKKLEVVRRELSKNINEGEVKAMGIYSIFVKQIRFLMVAVAFIVISFIGLLVFIKTGLYIIHPIIYIATLIMGTGWGLTALSSIKHNKCDKIE